MASTVASSSCRACQVRRRLLRNHRSPTLMLTRSAVTAACWRWPPRSSQGIHSSSAAHRRLQPASAARHSTAGRSRGNWGLGRGAGCRQAPSACGHTREVAGGAAQGRSGRHAAQQPESSQHSSLRLAAGAAGHHGGSNCTHMPWCAEAPHWRRQLPRRQDGVQGAAAASGSHHGCSSALACLSREHGSRRPPRPRCCCEWRRPREQQQLALQLARTPAYSEQLRVGSPTAAARAAAGPPLVGSHAAGRQQTTQRAQLASPSLSCPIPPCSHPLPSLPAHRSTCPGRHRP